ncbi:hypothetical protein PGIGA_G00251720 [Pangasianodon gigas]|uniref:Uncharacterized protein n=1 Tax=Pangasianodon gigas TaxID=30993 RepID=A0ACC5WQU0_PANGG|nr:hypothetical protein [Pangasianodon gigas]
MYSIFIKYAADTTVKPSVSLLPPSPLQLCEGSASLLCLLSGYSPQGALVSWTVDGSELCEGSASLLCLLSGYSPQGALVSWIVDGSEVKDGVLTSTEEEKKGGYTRSSTLTLSKDLWEKGEEFVCTVSHKGINHPVTFRKSQCEG